MSKPTLLEQYRRVRLRTEEICRPLQTEDYVVQPVVDVSPPKWHIGHTTWFFETFLLKEDLPGYQEYNPEYNFVFNSYYETIGARVIRTDRGNLSRPTVEEIYRYRAHVDAAMAELLTQPLSDKIADVVMLGLNHEEQHQELLYTDIKFILGHNPLFPAYSDKSIDQSAVAYADGFLDMPEGTYDIGFNGEGFCFDNEPGRHKVYLEHYSISKSPVSNAEYLAFIEAGGYQDFRYWHAEGWEWVKQHNAKGPMYWHLIDGLWMHYTLSGLQPVDPHCTLCHVNFYEAAAFAAWKGLRLPTETEWEAASGQLSWGERWEWTNSAYLPYPGYTRAPGAIGEYNGKFMVSQMVLRGASIATSPEHSRSTYRNFFPPSLQWQFTGIRLAK